MQSPRNAARRGGQGLKAPQRRLAHVVAEGLERWLPCSCRPVLDRFIRSGGLLKDPHALCEELARGQHDGGRRARQAACHVRCVLKLHLAGACLRGLGPGLGEVGPANNFQGLSDFQTWVCSLTMLLGRLELLSVLVLFTPSFWRK